MAELEDLGTRESRGKTNWLPWGIAGVGIAAAIYISKKNAAAASQTAAATEIPAGVYAAGASSNPTSSGTLATGLSATDLANGLTALNTSLQTNFSDIGSGLTDLATGIKNSNDSISAAITQLGTSIQGYLTQSQSAISTQLASNASTISGDITALQNAIAGRATAVYYGLATQSAAACVGGTRNGQPNVLQYCTNGVAALELNAAGVDPNNPTAVRTYVQSTYGSCAKGSGYDAECVGKIIANQIGYTGG